MRPPLDIKRMAILLAVGMVVIGVVTSFPPGPRIITYGPIMAVGFFVAIRAQRLTATHIAALAAASAAATIAWVLMLYPLENVLLGWPSPFADTNAVWLASFFGTPFLGVLGAALAKPQLREDLGNVLRPKDHAVDPVRAVALTLLAALAVTGAVHAVTGGVLPKLETYHDYLVEVRTADCTARINADTSIAGPDQQAAIDYCVRTG